MPQEGLPGEPVTFMFSGPDACRLMEQQLLQALAQPPTPPRTWRFCNVDKGQCAQLSISPLGSEAANPQLNASQLSNLGPLCDPSRARPLLQGIAHLLRSAPVGAGVPAKGCKAAPVTQQNSTGQRAPNRQ